MANGSWSYALNDADPDTNALAQGQAASDAFSYTIADANGASSTAALTIAITGANDAPVAVADGNGGDAVTESGVVAGDPSAAGNVLTNDTDVDTGDSRTVTAVNGSAPNVGAPLVGTYGTLTLGANGTWTYTLNDADPETNALAQGQVVTDAFSYTVSDANGASLDRGADHHHYRRQRCAGGDRGGGQRDGDGRVAAGDDGGRHHRLRRRRSHRRPRHIGHAGGNWLSRDLCRERDQRLDQRRHRAGDLAVRGQQCAAAVAMTSGSDGSSV